MEDGDDPELVRLRALNDRIEALCALRWDASGREDPTVVIAIDALDHEAAALIRARTDRDLAPTQRRLDAALVQAHRLLGRPPPEGVTMTDAEAREVLASYPEPEGEP